MSDLVSLERAAFPPSPDAVAVLRDVMYALSTGRLVEDRAAGQTVLEPTAAVCTRLAAAIFAIMLAPAARFRAEDYVRLAVTHTALVNALGSSGFGGADHVLRRMGPPRRTSPERTASAELGAYFRYFSLFGFDSGAALATVVGVLIEVPVMLSVVKIVNATKGWYERGAAIRPVR